MAALAQAWLVLDAAIVSAYVIVGVRASNEAYRHLREPQKTHWFTPLLEPDLFTPEGQAARSRAMRFWNWGGAAIIAYFLFRWWVRHQVLA